MPAAEFVPQHMSNLVAEGRVIIPNKASVFRVTDDVEPGMFVLNCASVPANNIYASGVLGQYFLFGEDIARPSARGRLRL